MSPNPRPRRLASVVTGVVMGALVLAGCGSGQSTAGNYADLEDNFIESCEATLVEDAAAADSGAAEVPRTSASAPSTS